MRRAFRTTVSGSVRPVLTRALVWGDLFPLRQWSATMGPAANAAVSTKWRDRMSVVGGGRGCRLPSSAAGSRYRSPRSSAGERGWWETVLSRIGADGSLRAARARGRGSSSCRHLLGRRHRAFRFHCSGGAIVTLPPQACCRAGNHRHSRGDVRRHGGRSPVLNVSHAGAGVSIHRQHGHEKIVFRSSRLDQVESLKQDPLSRATGSCS